MKARVTVTLREGVLDPQGQAIEHSLGRLGFEGVSQVRQGKVIELDIEESSETEAHKAVTEMCEQLLANTVIETYAIELVAS